MTRLHRLQAESFPIPQILPVGKYVIVEMTFVNIPKGEGEKNHKPSVYQGDHIQISKHYQVILNMGTQHLSHYFCY